MTLTAADFSKLSILVIDDSPFVCRLVQEVLASFGVGNIFMAQTADEAFAQLAIQPPDVIICDWQMHPVDGLTILRKLRQDSSGRLPRIPFIMLTGHNSTDDVATAVREGADSYIVKPFSAATLMSHLLKVILADKGNGGHQEAWAI